MRYIVIDCGTTNTRMSLIKDGDIIETIKMNVGARKNIEDCGLLQNALKQEIACMLKKYGLKSSDIKSILASGMITSEYGLCALAHINAPAGLAELRANLAERKIEEISDIPFIFARGVRLQGESLEKTDMMRGEETELMGIMREGDGECIYILPGSHSKLIVTDENGRIIDFKTMLTGEMIEALSQGTILKDAVDLSADKISMEYLIKGYDYCAVNGLNESLFKVRVLKTVFYAETAQVYSFFLGAILWGEINKIISMPQNKVIIAGKKQIKDAMYLILKERSFKEIVVIQEDDVQKSTINGILKIYGVK